jgi:hypothetical protein
VGLLLSVLAGCDSGGDRFVHVDIETHTAVVDVSGTAGKRFRGDFGVALDGDEFTSIALEGTIPRTEEVRDTLGTRLRATLRKVDPGSWTLTLCVQVDSQRTCQTTTAEFGQVTATASVP